MSREEGYPLTELAGPGVTWDPRQRRHRARLPFERTQVQLGVDSIQTGCGQEGLSENPLCVLG